MKVSFDSFLLEGGLNMLVSLKLCFASPTISLNVDPIKIFDTKDPFGLSSFLANLKASKDNSPVITESKFL